jgi:hypothetical protein
MNMVRVEPLLTHEGSVWVDFLIWWIPEATGYRFAGVWVKIDFVCSNVFYHLPTEMSGG